MPLLTYFNNMWYGSASGAVDGVAPTIGVQADIKGYAKMGESVTISLPSPLMKLYRLVNSPMSAEGKGEVYQALPKGDGRLLLDVSIGFKPSAFDIAQAVLQANASQYNVTGTIGNKINSAGSAGDPWGTELSGYTDSATFGGFVKKLLTVAKFLGLK